jgi:hypothetical protein
MEQFWGAHVETFFDRAGVIAKIRRKELKVLRGVGGYSRKVMRNSMKSGGKKGAVSSPGEPPRYHGRGLLRRLIFFGLEERSMSVAVGPALLASSHKPIEQRRKSRSIAVYADYRKGGVTMPQLVNEGGQALRVTRFPSGRTTKRTIRYAARPFVDLAKPDSLAKFIELLEKEPLN